MAEFNNMKLTTKGLALQSKAQTGVQLNFTKVQFGDGSLASGEDILNLTALKSAKMTTSISSNKVIDDGTSQIRTVLSNAELTNGFYLREVGIFAQDPDEGEILYAYTNSGEYADFIPAGTGNTIVENTFDLIVIVGNASNVTAVIPSGGYVSHQDWEEKNQEIGSQMADRVNQIEDLYEKSNTNQNNIVNNTSKIGNLAGITEGNLTDTVKNNRLAIIQTQQDLSTKNTTINQKIDNLVVNSGDNPAQINDSLVDMTGVNHTTLNNRLNADARFILGITGNTMSITRDNSGKIVKVEDKDANGLGDTTNISYNEFGEITQVSDTVNATTANITFVKDINGLITKINREYVG